MKYTQISDDSWFLRLIKDEEIMSKLNAFCDTHSIVAGYIQGIGGLKSVSLGVYRLSGHKNYDFQEFSGDLELVGLQGNVAMSEGERMLHLHAVVGKDDLSTVGGHMERAIVGGTVELYITKFDKKFERKLDSEIGLKLLEFPE